MRHRITIEKPDKIQDDLGGTSRVWTPHLCDIPANVQSVAGVESERGEQTEAVDRYTIQTHFREAITSTMRITWEGRVLNIIRVHDPHGNRRRMVIEAAEAV